MRSSVVLLIGWFVIGSFVFGDAKAQVLTAPRAVDQLQDMPAPKPKSAAAGLAAPSATSSAERALSANPLWTIPLISLTATRERPVFSPSRRPPAVVVAKAPAPPPPPPKPAEPEKPQLSLVGTILGENGERIGLFVNPADRNALRLKVGEDHKGWVLREVLPRQVVLEKGQQNAVLELPRPDMSKVASVPAASVPPAPSANRKTEAVVEEVAAASSSPVNNPKQPMSGFSPPRGTTGSPPVVAPIIIVQPPASEPQVNPFQKAWLY
jgi:hypothetical protein